MQTLGQGQGLAHQQGRAETQGVGGAGGGGCIAPDIWGLLFIGSQPSGKAFCLFVFCFFSAQSSGKHFATSIERHITRLQYKIKSKKKKNEKKNHEWEHCKRLRNTLFTGYKALRLVETSIHQSCEPASRTTTVQTTTSNSFFTANRSPNQAKISFRITIKVKNIFVLRNLFATDARALNFRHTSNSLSEIKFQVEKNLSQNPSQGCVRSKDWHSDNICLPSPVLSIPQDPQSNLFQAVTKPICSSFQLCEQCIKKEKNASALSTFAAASLL